MRGKDYGNNKWKTNLRLFFLFLSVADALHGTSATSATAGALAAFFSLYQAIGDQAEQSGKSYCNDDPREILRNVESGKHDIAPFVKFMRV